MNAYSRFHSFLGPDIEQFLAYKRALGRRYYVEEKTFALLDGYLQKHCIVTLSEITPTFIEQFLLSRPRPRPRSYNHLRCTLGRLFTHLVNCGKIASTPVQSPPRRAAYQRTPFIFDAVDARRLLALSKMLPDKGGTVDRGNTYHVAFAVLYGLGLRVSEVCQLRIEDVDFKQRLLVIRETKFYKSRLVPFGPRLESLLAEHVRRKLATCRSPGKPMLCLRGGRPINPGTISQTFHKLMPYLKLTIPPGVSPPRLHDLRHSFAVGTLTRWYRLGLDPQTRLLALATFLGHVDVNSTAIYLTTTQTLFDLASRRFKSFADPALKGGLDP
jgi:integrase/recombinase XerD